jgi:hypothetical protein
MVLMMVTQEAGPHERRPKTHSRRILLFLRQEQHINNPVGKISSHHQNYQKWNNYSSNKVTQYSQNHHEYIYNPRGKIKYYSQNYQKWSSIKKKNFVCQCELIKFIFIHVNPAMLFLFRSSRSHAAVPLQRE